MNGNVNSQTATSRDREWFSIVVVSVPSLSTKVWCSLINVTVLTFINNASHFFCRKKNLSPEDKIEYFISEKKDTNRVKAHVNAQFFKQLKFLLGELTSGIFISMM